MTASVIIHYGATKATLTYPEGQIDLNSLHGSERSTVRRAVVDAYCQSVGIEQKPKRRRKRKNR